jgi:hypothetical protein
MFTECAIAMNRTIHGRQCKASKKHKANTVNKNNNNKTVMRKPHENTGKRKHEVMYQLMSWAT